MLSDEEKSRIFHPVNAVMAIRFGIMPLTISNYRGIEKSVKMRQTQVYTLQKPIDEIAEIKAAQSNERHFYAEYKDKHYIILRKDFKDIRLENPDRPKIDVMNHLNDSNVYAISACHKPEQANKMILSKTLEYAKDVAEYLGIKEFCGNDAQCMNLETLLKDIKL